MPGSLATFNIKDGFVEAMVRQVLAAFSLPPLLSSPAFPSRRRTSTLSSPLGLLACRDDEDVEAAAGKARTGFGPVE